VAVAARPGTSEHELLPAPSVEVRARLGVNAVALAFVFVAAAVYHALQSRAHVTPAIFTDELLYSKLAQSIAAGEGLTLRGQPFFFPAPLAPLVQAPVWIPESVPTGYALAKAMNAALMASAAFPAYWLARQVVRPPWALVVAAATVASPALVYHAYLMSEALAYPVFFLAAAVMLRALTAPSRGWNVAVLAVSILAVGTRTQFVALPAAYVVTALVRRRGELRRHALPLAVFATAAAAVVVTGGVALGQYRGAALPRESPLDIARWSGLTGMLLPFAAGWLIAPGAVLGFAHLLRRPRTSAESAFGTLAVVAGLFSLVGAGVVAAVEADRPLERYVVYLVPLLFVAFFAYVERGAPRRRGYVALAIAMGLLAWLAPFPSLADNLFSFDSPTLSAYAMLASWIGHANAATVFSGGAFAGSLVIAAVRLRRRASAALAAASAALLVLTGLATYAADHRMTERSLRAWAAEPPDWLDRSGFGPADYLELPGASPFAGWTLEAWNKDFGRLRRLDTTPAAFDSFPSSRVEIGGDGVLRADGRPLDASRLVVNHYATALDVEGDVLARPHPSLTLYGTDGAVRARSLAIGLFYDGWATRVLRYRVWPGDSDRGTYRVRLALPAEHSARTVTLSLEGRVREVVRVRPGESKLVEIPVTGSPVPRLYIATDGADFLGAGTPQTRIVSVRIPLLAYVPTASALPARRSPSGPAPREALQAS
jgi:hypothetical protein